MAKYNPDENGLVLNRQKLSFNIGNLVESSGTIYKVVEILDFNTLVGTDVDSGRSKALRINELSPVTTATDELRAVANLDTSSIEDADWVLANQRYEAIKPLLAGNGGREAVNQRAIDVGVNPATLYRWLKRYTSLELVSALIPKQRGWREGSSRISDHAEALIKEVINDTYLTKQRSTAQKVIIEVKRRCLARGIEAPHPNTIRARINAISERHVLRGRGYREKAINKFMPAAGHFPETSYPLEVVQIDHTPVDIILVDDIHRQPIGRPFITLAIDIHTRMIVGYYLSFDPPSVTSVAMCVAHSVLPKDEWLALHNVEASWDVWGMMTTIHVDNGADFQSNSLKQSCLMHGINLEYRPVKQPRYGGHIERLIGTFAQEIHDLPGTTFSSIAQRDGYDSEKHAAITKSEFESLLVELICNVYHRRLHTTLGMTPERKWEIGLFGNATTVGHGLPPRPVNRMSLLLDFLPSFSRTVQQTGVEINGLRYYSDVLRGWISSTEPDDKSSKRKFTFRQDPRDISSIWFYDPDVKEYYQIPFANLSLPSMSVWEYQQARTEAKKEGMKSVDEHHVLRALTGIRKKVDESKAKTKKARREYQRRVEHEKGISPANVPAPQINQAQSVTRNKLPVPNSNLLLDDDIEPFSDIS